MLLDIHTHALPPYPEGIISCNPAQLPASDAYPDQKYSVGIHPWQLAESGMPTPDQLRQLEAAARRDDVVAIGECGIDTIRGGMLAVQRMVFARHVEISEAVGKPMVIHCVKAHDHIIGFHKDLKPTWKWAIHGFRGKPGIARMLTDAGIYLSFGVQFNPETVRSIPPELILAETDESGAAITEVIGALEETCGRPLRERIGENTCRFLE